jgi:polysaccharide export outer membrane protein
MGEWRLPEQQPTIGGGSCVEGHLGKKGLVMRLLRFPGFVPLLVILGLWYPAASFAQSALSSALSSGNAQQLLQSLSPSQQQAILSRLGGAGGIGGVGGIGGISGLGGLGSLASQAELQQLQQQTAVQQKRQEILQRAVVPQLKGGDWVIVEVGVTLPPLPSSESASESALLQQAYASQGGGSAGQIPALSALQGGSLGATGAGVPAFALTPSTTLQPLPADLSQLAAELPMLTPQLAQLSSGELTRIAAVIRAIREHNPYQLSPDGTLSLPDFAPIELLGLTQSQATLRLSVMPALQYLQVRITLLPLEKTGEQALKPFGYDVFTQQASVYSAITPLSNVPVPSNYVVGPGDAIEVQLYGNKNEAYQLTVGRDGRINLPELGPVSVGGMLFTAVQGLIESRVARQMIGVHASVSMAQTRSIEVFVMGDAFAPGVYTVSGLGTMTSALYAAGGIAKNGSLRGVQLIRDGKVLDTLDLYDLLIHGSSAHDAKLLQGDVVFVPPVGRTVALDGEVQRPALYELKSETTPAQAVALAGGLKPDADLADATVTRILPNGERVVLSLDLSGATEGLRNGDYIHVPPLKPALDQAVTLQGNVYNPGTYAYHPGMRLTDVLRSIAELKPNTDLHYVLIRREVPPDRHVVVVSANLAAALANPGSAANIPMMPRDHIIVFDLSSSRSGIVQPILSELRTESTAQQPEQVATVQGEVNAAGEYPLEPGMRVADLIRAGGGLANAAYTGKAELARYVVGPDGTRRTQIIDVDLTQAMLGVPRDNVLLKPFDVLNVEEVSQWANQARVTLLGEVRFPGTYTIAPGETLKAVIDRAGGLTRWAFPQGAVFTRTELKRREQQEMDLLAQRMKVELGVLALRASATSTGITIGAGANTMIVAKSLLQELKSEQAVGRLVINLPKIMGRPTDSPYDVILRNGDELIVPKFEQEVTVIGEVQDPTSHLYDPSLSRSDYIRESGGLTSQADEKRIYVVRADGSVVANGGSSWFSRGSAQIRPGDTIVVPINAEQMLPLPFWQAVTGILYNVAIAAAAVHAL